VKSSNPITSYHRNQVELSPGWSRNQINTSPGSFRRNMLHFRNKYLSLMYLYQKINCYIDSDERKMSSYCWNDVITAMIAYPQFTHLHSLTDDTRVMTA
jgi:hypothetical protein